MPSITSSKSRFTGKNKVKRLIELVAESEESRASDAASEQRPAPVFIDSDDAAVEARDVEVFSPYGITIADGISFRVGKGAFARIVGPTGCGKSSLIKCLFNYYGHKGNMFLFGREATDYSIRQIFDLAFYLPQDSFVFSGTVRENLLYGLECSSISDGDLVHALMKAQFTDREVGSFPEFLDRGLSENGKGLSGGQRQRLQAACLFLRSPKLLIADEPTASLDISTAMALMHEIKSHMEANGGTTVFIPHQEQAQEMADEYIEVGRSLEGTHGEYEVARRVA